LHTKVFILGLVFAGVLITPALAATVSVSASCTPSQTGSYPPIAGPGFAGCDSGSANPATVTASSQASASYSLVSGAFNFSLSTSANANAPLSGSSATASASASITDWLQTTGSLRPGYVGITCSNCGLTFDGGDASGGFTFSFQSIGGCSGCAYPLEPIELGEAFEVTAQASATAYSCFSCDGDGDGAASATYTLTFFEEDGKTIAGLSEMTIPATVTSSPEPGTPALAAVGLLGLLSVLRPRTPGAALDYAPCALVTSSVTA
jgi:hypothetical protein